jgi:hypothetical protein
MELKMRKLVLFPSLAILVLMTLFGCGRSSTVSDKDAIVKNIIKGANNVRSKILATKVFKEYKAYRDGNNFGVVYDYVVADNRYLVASPDTNVLKARIAKNLKRHPLYFKMSEFFNDGLYFRYVYRRTDGTVAYELTLDKNDF